MHNRNEKIIPQYHIERQRQAAFAEMIPGMVMIRNPHKFVYHASGWSFILRSGAFGQIVLASPPGYCLSAACFVVEGHAARHVIELLDHATRNTQHEEGE